MHQLWARPPGSATNSGPFPSAGGRGRWKVPEGQAARALGDLGTRGPRTSGTAARQLPRNTAAGVPHAAPPAAPGPSASGPQRPHGPPRRHLPPSVRFRPGPAAPHGEGRGRGGEPAPPRPLAPHLASPGGGPLRRTRCPPPVAAGKGGQVRPTNRRARSGPVAAAAAGLSSAV